MDIMPIYELQARLKSAAIAGVNLLQEDFRLKRAAAAVKPLEGASPVFAKLNQQIELLLSPDCGNPAAALLDALSLTDAVICTLGAVEVKGAIEAYEICHKSNQPVRNAPCSQVKGLIEALTVSGSGNFAFVRDMHETNPEVFDDYRVKYALVQALGASYAELADMVARWMAEKGDEMMIPLLKEDFDPKGKKEMVRRVQVIDGIAGAAENEYYIKMLADAEKEVRQEFIYALRHEPSNIELLLGMVKSEKGKNRRLVLDILGYMDDERVYGLFHSMAAKKPLEVCGALLPVTTECASRVIAQMCMEQLPDIAALCQSGNTGGEKIFRIVQLKNNLDGKKQTDEVKEKISVFCRTVEALTGKQGEEVIECYRQLLAHKDIFDRVEGMDIHSNVIEPAIKQQEKKSWEYTIGWLMAQSLLVYPDEKLKQFVMELYGEDGGRTGNANFLTAAAVVKMSEAENCAEWLDTQLESMALAAKKQKTALKDIAKALGFVMWNKEKNSYMVDAWFGNINLDDRRGSISRSIKIPGAKGIKEWMMRHGSSLMDTILHKWIDKTDTEECAKYGEYFYNRAFTVKDNKQYLDFMRDCGWKTCKGLAGYYLKNMGREEHWWNIQWYLRELPGDYGAVQEEINAAAELVRSGEVKIKGLDTAQKIEDWIDKLRMIDFKDHAGGNN